MAGSMSGGGVQFSQTMSNAPAVMNPAAIVGSTSPQPWERSVLDGRRMMYGNRTPNADWPDGYIGTITSRRGDRLFDSLKARINQRSYQRGTHLGERVDPGSYLFPDDMQPLSGIERQATTGLRHAPLLEYFAPTPTIDGKLAPRGSESVLTIDAHRAAQLSMLRPTFGLPSKRSAPYQG